MNRAKQHANKSDNWVTPQHVIDLLYGPKGPDLDVCAADATVARAPRFYTPEQDGLKQPWDGLWWCNPPFSMAQDFITRARFVKAPGFMLLPASVGTAWFSELLDLCIATHSHVLFCPKRIQFLDPKTMKPSINSHGKRSSNTVVSIVVAFRVPAEYIRGKAFIKLEAVMRKTNNDHYPNYDNDPIF